MNQSTNTTASIDLAQLDNLQNYYSPHGTLIRLADAKCVFMEFARRSLTSGAPADTGAVAIFPPELPKFMPGFFSTMKECWDHAVLSGWRAASVHDAAAPSNANPSNSSISCGAAGPSAKPADKIEEIRALLQEAHGFAAVSPRGKENINAALDLLDEISVSAGAAAKTEQDDEIRGPLTDAQREECRTLYNNLKHLQCGGIYVADDVIRRAAVFGYMNGRKDFGTPATAAGAGMHECTECDGTQRISPNELCARCDASGIVPDRAAGAGSAQPRAEGDELHIGMSNNDQGVHVNIIQRHADRTSTVVFTAKVPPGDSYARATLAQGAQAATTASARDAGLREAVRAITLLIRNREWADVLDMYADAAALWDAVDDVISDRAALARAPLPAQGVAEQEGGAT